MPDSNGNKNNYPEFDWGPPTTSSAEKFKDIFIYLLIIIVISLGVWQLLDLHSNPAINPAAIKIKQTALTNSTSNSVQKNANTIQNNNYKFYVQLAAFADKQDAKEAYNRLKSKGYNPALQQPTQDYEVYKVSLGPYNSEEQANEISEKLNNIDFSCFVVESP